jgi:hypothetical protein
MSCTLELADRDLARAEDRLDSPGAAEEPDTSENPLSQNLAYGWLRAKRALGARPGLRRVETRLWAMPNF